MLPDPNDPLDVMQAEVVATWMKEVLEEGTEPLEPISSIYVPIVDQVGAVTPSPQVGKAVGIMNLSVYWRDLLKDILPSGSRGVIVVFENECGPVPFTYQIDGPRTTYLGRGDLHEKNFDHLELACRLANVHGYSVGGRKYTGLPLDEQTCPFNLRVYPSTDMRNDYNSKDPVIFTLLAVLIFVFTTGVFGMYDCCVERRQKVVMSTVRERTRTLEDTNRRLEEANRKVVQASALQLEHFACMR